MSFASRATSLQSYNMLLYRQAVHPEFFAITGRQRIEHGDYEFEAWIFKGGHALRFQHDSTVAIEIVTDQIERLPNKGLVTAMPCAGEKDHDQHFGDALGYMTSIQTETLTDHLYLGTYNELVEHARLSDGLLTAWTDEIGRHNLSLIDTQRYSDEVHVQAYHCRSDCSLVLRTQTIFQVKDD